VISYEILTIEQCVGLKTARVEHPLVGNSLFAIVLALLHAPPMLALLWTQRSLRRRSRFSDL
jgi:hypothetical protein